RGVRHGRPGHDRVVTGHVPTKGSGPSPSRCPCVATPAPKNTNGAQKGAAGGAIQAADPGALRNQLGGHWFPATSTTHGSERSNSESRCSPDDAGELVATRVPVRPGTLRARCRLGGSARKPRGGPGNGDGHAGGGRRRADGGGHPTGPRGVHRRKRLVAGSW